MRLPALSLLLLLAGCGARPSASPPDAVSRLLEALQVSASERVILSRALRAGDPDAWEGLRAQFPGRVDPAVAPLMDLMAAHAQELEAMRTLAAWEAEEAAPAFRERLASADPALRAEAAWGARAVGDAEALPGLRGLLADPAPEARAAACAALGILGTEGDRAALRPLLDDPDIEVVVEASLALGYLGDPEIVWNLEDLLQVPDEALHGEAVLALQALDTPEARAVLARAGESRP